ncbi:DUF3822 family protein [Luteibaculum oceani]|uniref:DUF3822 family protein n=1 Tax=Luteibaculum oceani TaxID=1294296 RepID=UPI001477020A
MPEAEVWSEVISLPFNQDQVSVDQIHRVKKFTEGYRIGQNQVYIGISSRMYTIVPRELYDPAKKGEYLIKNTGAKPIELGSVITSPVQILDSYIVFNISNTLDHFLNNHFPGMVLLHEKQSLVAAALSRPESSERQMVVNFSGNHFDIIVVDQRKVKFFNSFSLMSTEDVLYYLLFVTEKLGYDVKSLKIQLFGKIPEQIDKEALLKYLPITSNVDEENEFLSLKFLPRCES